MSTKPKLTQGEFAQKMEFTPAMAAKTLDGHKNYRGLAANRVAQYAKDMKKGEWDANGQPILFDENGNLIDGQHRLRACIQADCSFTSWVIYGISAKNVDTIDTGRGRTLRELLERRKYPKAQIVSAALQYVFSWETTGKLLRETGKSYPSRKTLLDALERHPSLSKYCAQNKALTSLGLSNPFTSALRYVLIQSSSEEVAFQFLGELAIGDMLPERSPVFQLRKRLIHNMRIGTRRMGPRTQIALITKAWNLWIAGVETSSVFKWTSVGPSAEEFPSVLKQSETEEKIDG